MVMLNDDSDSDKVALVADKYGDIYKIKLTSPDTLEDTIGNYYFQANFGAIMSVMKQLN